MKSEHFPALYRASDALSLLSQKNFFAALWAHLACLILAAGISVLNSPCAEIAILQAIVLLGALGFAIYLAMKKPEKMWYSGRAVAESIKTITWRFVTKAEPFDGNELTARDHFLETLKNILAQNIPVAQNLSGELNGTQVTNEMLEIRNKDLDSRRAVYLQLRITDQLDWYANKARFNQSKAKRFFIGIIGVNALAIIFAIAKVKYASAPYWPTDVLITLAASILAWSQAKRFSELAASYALAANEISLIRDQSYRVKSETEFSLFVANAENAFSREHTQWVARLDR